MQLLQVAAPVVSAVVGIGEYGEKLRQARIADQVSNALTQSSGQFNDFVRELQDDPDYSAYEDKFNERVPLIRTEVMSGIKEERAKEIYSLEFDKMTEKYKGGIFDYARTKEMDHMRANLINNVEDAVKNRDISRADMLFDWAVDAGIIDRVDAEENKRNAQREITLLTLGEKAAKMGDAGISWLGTVNAEDYELDPNDIKGLIGELKDRRQTVEAEMARQVKEMDAVAWNKGTNAYYRGELRTIAQVEELQEQGLSIGHANDLKRWIVASNKAAIADYKRRLKGADDRLEDERKNLISKIEYDIDRRKDSNEVQTEILDNAELLGEIDSRDLITKNNKRVWSDPAYKRGLDTFVNASKNGTLSDEQRFNMQDQFRKHFEPLIFKPDGTLREDRPPPEDIMDYADSMIQPFIKEFAENVLKENIKPFGYKRRKYKEKWGDRPGDVGEIQDIEQYEEWISEGVYHDLSPEELKQHQPLFERVREEQEWHYKRWSKNDWNEAAEWESTELTDYGHAVFTDVNGRKWAFYIVNNNEVLREWAPLDKTSEETVKTWVETRYDQHGRKWGWNPGAEWMLINE